MNIHDITEIYTIHNGNETIHFATKEYIENQNIPTPKYRERRGMDDAKVKYAVAVNSHVNNEKPLRVLTPNGIMLIYLYGEKTWFESAEARAEYRAQVAFEKARQAKIKKVKAELDARIAEMDIDEMRDLLATLSKK